MYVACTHPGSVPRLAARVGAQGTGKLELELSVGYRSYHEFFEGTKSKISDFEGKIFTNHPKERLEI